MSKKKYEGIYPALKILFDISTKQQQQVIRDGYNLSVMSYLKEFCTIRIMTSRRGGHDYGLAKLLHKLKLKTIVISPNIAIASNFLQTYEGVNGVVPDFIIDRIYSVIDDPGWLRATSGENDIDIVAVNPSFMLSKSLEDKLYTNIATTVFLHRDTSKPFYIVFVQ